MWVRAFLGNSPRFLGTLFPVCLCVSVFFLRRSLLPPTKNHKLGLRMSKLFSVSCIPVREPLVPVFAEAAASAARTARAVCPELPPPLGAYMLAAAPAVASRPVPAVPVPAPARPLPTCVMTRKCPRGGESPHRRSPSVLAVVTSRFGGGTGAMMDRCCSSVSRSAARSCAVMPPIVVPALAPLLRWWHWLAAAPMVLQKVNPVVAFRSRNTYGLAVTAARLR